MALKFRRGTTAQQSGSLAFGEPYVNTTLGTLLIGGPNGDIVLSTTGTGSTGNFGPISGSGLDITGNANIAGNLTLGGTITIGDATTDNVVVNADLSSSIIPNNDNAFDLGSAAARYRAVYANNLYGAINATNGVVSGSSQVISILTSLNSFSASNGNTSLNSYTASNDTTNNAQNSRLTNLESATASLSIETSNLEVFSASQLTKDSTLQSYTASVDTKFSTLQTYTASVDSKFTTLQTLTASTTAQISRLQESTASLNAFSASENTKSETLRLYTASVDTKFSTLATYTASVDSTLARLRESTASINLTTASLNGHVADINSYTSSLKTAITVAGSDVTVAGNLTVNGTTTTVNSTTVNIGDSILELNYGGAAVRGGLLIKDATAASLSSGSFLWDGTNDIWIAGKSGSEAKVLTDGMSVVSGSAQIDATATTNWATGIKTQLNSNTVVSGSSQINFTGLSGISANIISASTDSSNVDFIISGGSITANLFGGVVSGSAQVVGILSSLNSFSASNGNTSLNSYTASNDTTNTTQNTRLSRLEESTASLNAYTGGFASSVVTLTNKTISGASNTLTNIGNSSLTNSSITIAGQSTALGSSVTAETIRTAIGTVVTGSSQITAGSTTNFATDVKTQLNTNTVVSGSSQINLGSAAGNIALSTQTTGDYVASLVAGTNITLSNNSGEGATPTIGLTNNSITIAGQSTSLGGTITAETIRTAIGTVVTGSSQINFTQLSGISANIISSSSDTTNVDMIINGGSISANLMGGVVSGSSQITAGSTTNFATDVKTQLNSNTVVSGSSQVTLASTTGFGTYIDQALLTTSNVTHGNLTLTGNLTVGGTTTTINSTTVNIADNIIQLNGTGATNAGIVVRDATASTTTSGSLLWDTTNDYWIAGPLGSELPIATTTGTQTLTNKTISGASNTLSNIANASLSNSSITIAGQSTALGSSVTAETIRTAIGTVVTGSAQISHDSTTGYSANRHIDHTAVSITAGTGLTGGGDISATRTLSIDSTVATLTGTQTLTNKTISGASNTLSNIANASLTNSSITIAGTSTALGGSITAATILQGTGVVSGSSQIVGSSITTNTITIGSTSTALGGTSTTLAGLTSVSSTGFTGALTGNASTATTLQTARTINGTSFNGSADITIPNLVSGSAQITAGSTTNFATDVKTQLNVNTVISGSSQVFSNVSGDITIASNGVATIAANSVALGTDTTGNYMADVSAGTGISVSHTPGEGSTATITNSGVTSNVAGSGISVSGATGAVTITNTGVTSNVAGTGVSVSGATGAVTISIGQAVATSSNVQFNSLGVGMAASATAGRIDATNDIVAFSSSDIRFKENIKPIENPIEKIRKISGNTYDWKEENKIEHGYEGNDVGVIAQEIEEVLPQLVQTRESGYKAVKYDKLVALLIEGIKEQQLQIEKLQLEVVDLKKQKGL